MCYTAIAVANYFIKKSLDGKVPITHMHLQKMLFLAHAFYFKHYGNPLISDPFVAWQHGPVIETLYHELKKYGNEEITDLIITLKPLDKTEEKSVFPYRVVTPFVNMKDTNIVNYLDSVWDSIARVDTWRLRSFSHQKGGAWYKTVGELEKPDGGKVDPSNDEEVRKFLPRNLTILDKCIQECGR